MVAANAALAADDYVAILKCKASERGAAASCLLDTVVPLFEVREPEQAAQGLIQAWPASSGVMWVQSLNLRDVEETGFAAAVGALFARLHPEALAVPVITTSESAALLAAVRTVVAEQGRGLVLRIDVEEVMRLGRNLRPSVDAVLAECAVAPSAVDVVVDAGLVTGAPPVRSAVVTQALQALPHGRAWRSLVVALSAFPPDVSAVDKDSVGEFARADAATFDVVTGSYPERRLTYADYTLGRPSHVEPPPRSPIPNIKYTHERTWKVHRAHERNGPSPQYRALAGDVVAAPYFASAQFSPGDDYIRKVATGAGGPGNARTHLQAGISRHVHVVAHRLATLGVP